MCGMYAVSTTLMWAGRVLIKELYELSSISKGVANALVYGVKEGGVGLAKSVRNEKPSNFHIRGFISHNGDLNGHLLMGVGVYQVEDLPDVLDRFRIRAVLVSPQLNNEFRNDQPGLLIWQWLGISRILADSLFRKSQVCFGC